MRLKIFFGIDFVDILYYNDNMIYYGGVKYGSYHLSRMPRLYFR